MTVLSDPALDRDLLDDALLRDVLCLVRHCDWCSEPLRDRPPLVLSRGGETWSYDVCDAHVVSQLRRLAAVMSRRPAVDRQAQRPRRLQESESLEHVRAWARAHGLPVAAHGGLSVAVMEAYRART